MQFLCLLVKNLNSGCGVACISLGINFVSVPIMVYIYFFFLLFLFSISVNRSFIRFRGNTPGHVFLDFLHYSIGNVVFVFEVAVCVVWGRWNAGGEYCVCVCGCYILGCNELLGLVSMGILNTTLFRFFYFYFYYQLFLMLFYWWLLHLLVTFSNNYW